MNEPQESEDKPVDSPLDTDGTQDPPQEAPAAPTHVAAVRVPDPSPASSELRPDDSAPSSKDSSPALSTSTLSTATQPESSVPTNGVATGDGAAATEVPSVQPRPEFTPPGEFDQAIDPDMIRVADEMDGFAQSNEGGLTFNFGN